MIAERIIAGERLKPDDDLEFLLKTPLEKLQNGAKLIQEKFFGNRIDFCTIINGKSGRCGEDCKYCAQSARHKTGIDEYPFLPPEKILEVALSDEKAGVNRFSIVTSGRNLDEKSFELAIETYKLLRDKLKIELCASHGILTAEQLKKLKSAGVKRYHHNLETSRRFFPQKTGIDEYPFLPPEKILEVALSDEKAGVNRFSIVTSGRNLDEKSFELAIETYKLLRDKLKIELCASHGILTAEQLKKLKSAGVKRYHHNLETSRRFFPQICTTHTFDDRIRTIKLAQAADLEVCSGGIIGMGENWQDRIDLAFELANLGIKSIPINILNPIKGTPLENLKILAPEDILRTIAIFRYINPTANVRLAAGRKFLPDNGASAFLHGASAAITGNMLTTSNTNIKSDLKLLNSLGLTNNFKEE